MWQSGRLGGRRKRTPAVFTRSGTSLSPAALRRRHYRMYVAMGSLLFALLSIGGSSWLSHSHFLAIETIRIEGLTTIPEAAVLNALNEVSQVPLFFKMYSRQNIVSYPKATLEGLLTDAFPRMLGVQIQKRLFAREVVVSVQQREPYARWCTNDTAKRECYVFDATGYIFEPTDSHSVTLTFFGGLSKDVHSPLREVVDGRYIDALIIFIEELYELDLTVQEVWLDGADATLVLAPSWSLVVALDKDLRATAFNLDVLLQEQHLQDDLSSMEYIDMRFDERVYIKERTSPSIDE